MTATRPKRVVLANSLTGFGKVSIQTALPILAVAQLEAALLPTVLLSSHTAYPNPYITSFEKGMDAFVEKWEEMEMPIDGVITGYLRTAQEVQTLQNMALELVVDPVMGDGGRLYKGFTVDFIQEEKELCKRAKVILPNVTEARFLLDLNQGEEQVAEGELEEMARALASLGPEEVLITGVPLNEARLGVAYFSKQTQHFQIFETPRYPHYFVGTGDLLTALVGAAHFRGLSLPHALPHFLSFMDQALRTTIDLGWDGKQGVYYQPHLGQLLEFFKGETDEKE